MFKARNLPATPTNNDNGIWFIKPDGVHPMRIYVIDAGVVIPLSVNNLQEVSDAGNMTSQNLFSVFGSAAGFLKPDKVGVEVVGSLVSTTAFLELMGLVFTNNTGVEQSMLFPKAFISTKPVYMPISVNGEFADEHGNVEVPFPSGIKDLIIVNSNRCYESWNNETRFIYRTSTVCILANSSNEGKEILLINDSGNSLDIAVSSSSFKRVRNSPLSGNQYFTAFPAGFKGRFRVIGGEFFEVG